MVLIPPDWLEFLRLLNSRGVRYLVVGGHALAYHGAPRFTSDLDCFFLVEPSNVELLGRVIREFGFQLSTEQEQGLGEVRTVFRMGYVPFRIDLLNDIDGVVFSEAWERREMGDFGGVEVPFIGRQDLIATKLASGRKKDLADLEALGNLPEPS